MNRAFKIILLLLTLVLILPTLSLSADWKVIRVYDGDTIKAEGYDIEIKVRLVGIDAPEISRKKRQPGQPYSQQAKKYLADLVLNKIVDIKGYGLDRYNRILGVIYLYPRNINLEMVKAGLAEVYRGKLPRAFDATPYQRAEVEAWKSDRGMWSLGDNYIRPKEWRKMHK